MSDPNGAEAGAAFLAANKDKDGVITLASGLQYKVLEEGAGMEHPTVSTPCECHYAGRLLDGTEFDSSYKRGTPTTFAPNQVIKGWTEAMQLMVQGDKWEMYIPYELAYGAAGKPPKIPAKACLIFIMEIVKIKGATTAKKMVFPEWTADELALWLEKDEAACVSWREARSTKWEGGDEKLKASYPTREELDKWLDTQCKSSKDKSLWKRTRLAKKKAAAGAGGGGAPAGPPALTAKTARSLLDKAMATFQEPANKAKLTALVEETKDAGDDAAMMRMMKMMPMLQTMLGPTLKEYGYGPDELMTVATQLMGFGAEDPTIAADTSILMKAAQGDLSDFFA
jgi:FKBP-type peptidyl-prolyl cis-trans isomerase FklB